MRHTLLIALGACFLLGACSRRLHQPRNGTYVSNGKGYYYSLSLSDSSFSLTQRFFEVNAFCKGTWKQIHHDTLLLKCEDVDLSAQVLSGYMSDRETKVIVHSRNKIQIDAVSLKRVR